MSSGARVPYADGYAAAVRLAREFEEVTNRRIIAGSLRRQANDVGDIELVVVPVLDTVGDGFFASKDLDRFAERIDTLIECGYLASHPDDPKRGARYSKVVDVASGLQVDLFSTSAETFGMMLLIRTGPADYSRRFVTDLRKRGLHVGNHAQLHRGGLGCGTYVCDVLLTPEESDVYEAAGWPFVNPEDRQ